MFNLAICLANNLCDGLQKSDGFFCIGRPSATPPSVLIASRCAGISPAVHPAPPLALHGWGLALRTRAGPT